jgi:hypothetical protein
MVTINKNKTIMTCAVTILFILALFASVQGAENRTEQVNSNVMTEAVVPDGSAQASTANAPAPKMVNIPLSSKPPVLTPEKQKQREEYLDKIHLPGPSVIKDKEPAGPSGDPGNAVSLTNAPGTFTIFKNSALGTGAPSSEKSVVNEPSVGTNGNNIFYTGNWYAARSTDGGATFSYIDPYADMPEFCCDQEVIYDPSRDIFIWYRQGVADANGVNRFRLGISNDNAASWYFYDLYPTNTYSGWTNQWWDYPHIALGNNYLYIASNMFNQFDFFTRTVLLRISLDQLKAHGALNYNYIGDSTHGTFTPVQGATTTMYWGTHNSVSSLRIYEWGENSSIYSWYDRAIPAWTDTPRGGAHCAGPDGYNWCARTDDRLTGGWLANGTIGFFWNVKEGAGFTYPYINSATFVQSNKSYIGRPNIWSSSYAFQYGYASPDRRGNLGIAAFYGGGSLYPSSLVGISDDYSAGWELLSTGTGTNGPNSSNWGDYLRVRPVTPSGKIWAATGYTLQGGGKNSNADPRYIEFGRERDTLIPLGEAVDNTALTWTTDGNALWYGETATSFFGGDAAQSDTISNGQGTWIQTSVTGPGTLNFTWNVSSELNKDFLRFYIDGIAQNAISGETGWLSQNYSIGSGNHTLRWNYTKDNSINSGSDAGWLDKVEFSSITDIISPTVVDPSANQSDIPDDTDNISLWGETAQLNVTVTDTSGIASVTLNLTEIGGPEAKPMTNNGGNVYSTTTNASAGTTPMLYNLTVTAIDTFGNPNTSVKIGLRVRKNGDTNGNNAVNIGDALRLANNVSYPGNPAYALSSIYVAEVSGNGMINIGDALRLANNVSYPGNPAYILK